MGWLVLFLVIISLVSVAVILVVALTRPAELEHASELKGYELVECSYQQLKEGPTHRDLVTRHMLLHEKDLTTNNEIKTVRSRNWAGYVTAPLKALNSVIKSSIKSSIKNSIKDVSASWVVPHLKPTPYSSSIAVWVGVDGFLNESAIQIGSHSEWSVNANKEEEEEADVQGQQVNYGWFRMGSTFPMTMVVGFPVGAGDTLSAAIVNKGKGQASMTLRNDTRSQAVVLPTSLTNNPQADWVNAAFAIELPHEEGNSSETVLADFNSVSFRNCVCTIGNKRAGILAKDRQCAPVHLVSDPDVPILSKLAAQTSPLNPNQHSFSINRH